MSKSFKEIFKVPTLASNTLSAEFSPKIRTFMKIVIYFGTWIFMIVAIPIMSISKLIVKSKPDSFKNLQVELETLWYSQSSNEALRELRRVYSKLNDDSSELHFKGINVEPYGKFKFPQHINVIDLLYHYEMRHKNWVEANEICDSLLEPLLKRKEKMKGALDKYIVYKAKAIYHISGNVSAQEYLLKHINHERKDNLIRKYLYELRDKHKN